MLGPLPLCLLLHAHLGQVLHGSESNCKKKAPTLPALVLSIPVGNEYVREGSERSGWKMPVEAEGRFQPYTSVFW